MMNTKTKITGVYSNSVHPLVRALFPLRERLFEDEDYIYTNSWSRKDAIRTQSNEEILQDQSERVKKQLFEVRRRKDILETKYRILKPIFDNDEIGTYELRISQVNGWEEKLKRTAERIEAKLSEESVKEKIIQ